MGVGDGGRRRARGPGSPCAARPSPRRGRSATSPGGTAAAPGAARRTTRASARRNAVVHDPDALGIDTELRHHLVGHELRGSVHPRTFGHGSADHAGEAERGAITELGKVHGGEVVHGDDPGGAATGGDDEVGSVDDVDGPDEPLDRRTAPRATTPDARGGRAWPVGARRTPGGTRWGSRRRRRHVTANASTSSSVTRGESAQGALAESTHSRSRAEQRRGVDGHPETLAFGSRSLRHRASLAHRAPGVWARTVSLAP